MAPPLPGPALGLLELESLARGVVVADALVKQAQVEIVIAEATTPGKYLLIFCGGVSEVGESFQAALAVGGSMVIDSLYLPHLDEGLLRAVLRNELSTRRDDDSVGIVELHTVAATLKSADVALKLANVTLTQIQLARGIGGKGWFTLAGEQHDVEAALEGAASSVPANLLVTTELIQRPHPDLRGRVL